MRARGLIVAAASSGSGKTTLTLALLRLLARSGARVASAKAGPDYIDAAFHTAASHRPCLNLDPWAMRPSTLAATLALLEAEADLIVCEGVMGLFDGIGADGEGSTADLAAITGWPVVLVLDVFGQSATAAAVLAGLVRHRPAIRVAGVILNRTGSPAHGGTVAEACRRTLPDVVVLGSIPRSPALTRPERHLGLVQAREQVDLDAFLDRAAGLAEAALDIPALIALALPSPLAPAGIVASVPPPGQRIAVADDLAFAFAYPAMLAGWQRAGAEVVPFSPLADEAPGADADAVFLPGGYPELHAGRLAANAAWKRGVAAAARRGAQVYGECGGYMALGRGLVDARGHRHEMAGLLPVETSFAERKLHLGYREIVCAAATPLGPAGTRYRGHEFHYASETGAAGDPLFEAGDARGGALGPAGRRTGTVFGSFLHLIDRR
ncbi:MAG: cobyrinate a,c-diamide synthase [Alphaproteobacteria bacterium]|nr:cobyrinate a,c-diamide synthase [Alphaproteobacteria bacterium]